jgi:hypothetical protein
VYSCGVVTQLVELRCVGDTPFGKLAPRCEPGDGKAAPRLDSDGSACAIAPTGLSTAKIKVSRNSFSILCDFNLRCPVERSTPSEAPHGSPSVRCYS